MKKVITSALIYANGPIHLGHLVEIIQTDIYSRYSKLIGEDSIYMCADDTHGTPIQVNAEKLGISPEKLIKKAHKEHNAVLQQFGIKFDKYYSTNSPENKELTEQIYNEIKKNGYIYQKEVESTYCESCKRFLPDRYVKGICPSCGAEDQYGDGCEKCNTIYKPVDLKEPKCTICGSSPTRKKTNQVFFKLSELQDKLKDYIENTDFQKNTQNYLLNWLDDELRDWEISRDEPYFGFKIPDMEENKFFYVWFDAPIGYISTTKKYCEENGLNWEDYWKSNEGEIIHFIGKDIIYFHFLFWPAVLIAAGINLPKDIHVHGFLTVNGEKMSKSRGTFITGKDYIDLGGNPQYLRMYYAYNLNSSSGDFDFSEDYYKDFVNHYLIGKYGNLIYRSSSFLYKNFEGITSKNFDKEIVDKFTAMKEEYINLIFKYEYRKATELFFKYVDIANKYFQDNEPWKLIKENKDKAHTVLTTALLLINKLNILINPIMPSITKKIAKNLNFSINYDDFNTEYIEHTINKPKMILKKIEDDFTLVKESPIKSFDLKLGQIKEVENHPEADKLFVTQIDFGSEQRQIVAGLKNYYTKEELINMKVVVICNLKPAKLRGVDSNGMILAAEDNENNVGVITCDGEIGNNVIPQGETPNDSFEEMNFKKFSKIKLKSTGDNILFEESKLFIDKNPIYADKKIKGDVS